MLRRCCGDRPRAMILALVCCCFARNVEPEDKTEKKKTDGDDDFYAPIKSKKRGKKAKKAGRKGQLIGHQDNKIIKTRSGHSQEFDNEGLPSTSRVHTEEDEDKDKESEITYENAEDPTRLPQNDESELQDVNDSNPVQINSSPMQDYWTYYYCSRGISSEDEDEKECERQFDYAALDVTCEDSDEELFHRIQTLETITPELPDSETEGNVDYKFPTFQEISSRVEESMERTFGRDPFTITAEELTWISTNPQDIGNEFDESEDENSETERKPPNDPWRVIQETKPFTDSSCSRNSNEDIDFSFYLKDEKERESECFYSMATSETSQTTEYDISFDEETREIRGAAICGVFQMGSGHIDERDERGPTKSVFNEKSDKSDEESRAMVCWKTVFPEDKWRQDMKNKEAELQKEEDSGDEGFPFLHSVGRKSREHNRLFRSSDNDNARRSPASPVRLRLHMCMTERDLQSGDSSGILKWHTRRSTLKAANKMRLSEKRCHCRNH